MRRLAVLSVLALVLAGCSQGGSTAAQTSSTTSSTSTTTSTTTTSTTTTTTIPVEQRYAQIEEEIVRACNEAIYFEKDPAPEWNSDWSDISSREKLMASVQECLRIRNEEREAELARREAEAIAGAQTVDVDAIVKNPDATAGQYFVLVSLITQYDGATGPCAFRGYWDSTVREYNFEYEGDNAYFTGGDGLSNCPILDGIDQDDTVRLWVRSEGTLSYDTQIGGNTTVPSFLVVKAEIIAKG